MPCPVCQKEVDPQAAFCGSCGAPATPSASTAGANTGYTTVPQYASVPNPVGYAPQAVPVSSGLSDNVASALAYVTIIPAIVFLVLEPYNKVPLIRFHSWQSVFLFIGSVVLQFGLSLLSAGLHFIPLIWILFAFAHFVVAVALFIVWLIAILKASKGEWYKIPFIGDYAEKQARSL